MVKLTRHLRPWAGDERRMGRHVQARLPLEPKLVEGEAFFLQLLKLTKLTYSTDVISSLPVCREHAQVLCIMVRV